MILMRLVSKNKRQLIYLEKYSFDSKHFDRLEHSYGAFEAEQLNLLNLTLQFSLINSFR